MRSFAYPCPHCAAPLSSPLHEVGVGAACGACRRSFITPAPDPKYKPNWPPIKAWVISPQMFKWECPKCGMMQNARMSSLGTVKSCQNCKYKILFPDHMD